MALWRTGSSSQGAVRDAVFRTKNGVVHVGSAKTEGDRSKAAQKLEGLMMSGSPR